MKRILSKRFIVSLIGFSLAGIWVILSIPRLYSSCARISSLGTTWDNKLGRFLVVFTVDLLPAYIVILIVRWLRKWAL